MYTTDERIRPIDRQNFTIEDAKREAAADFFADVLFKGKEYRGEIANALKYGDELPSGNAETSLSALEELAQKDKNLFVRIWDAVKRFISNLKNHTTNNSVVRDLEKLERKLQDVYNSAENKNTAEDDGVKHYLGNNRNVLDLDIDWDSNEHSTIKEQLREHIDKVSGSKKVISITFNKEKPYNIVLGEIIKNFGGKISTRQYGDILFDEKAIKNLRHYVTSDEEAAAIITAPYVLKRGIAISGHKNHKYKGYPSVTFAGKVEINGVEGIVGVCVLYADKNRVHSLRILAPNGKEFELIKTDTKAANSGSTEGVNTPTESVSKYSIRQNSQKSQENVSDNENLTETEAFKKWFGESKAVNKDGTPRML